MALDAFRKLLIPDMVLHTLENCLHLLSRWLLYSGWAMGQLIAVELTRRKGCR